MDIHIFSNGKTGKDAQLIFLYDPLVIQMLLQITLYIALMAAHKCNRQAIQACITVFHMLARTEKDDLGQVFRIDADVDIAHNGKYRQKIHFYRRIRAGRNDNVRIKFWKFCLQFRLHNSLDRAICPVQSIDGKTGQEIFNKSRNAGQVPARHFLSQCRKRSIVKADMYPAYGTSPGADLHRQRRFRSRHEFDMFDRIPYEHAVRNVVNHAGILILPVQHGLVIGTEEHVVPNRLNAGTYPLLDKRRYGLSQRRDAYRHMSYGCRYGTT